VLHVVAHLPQSAGPEPWQVAREVAAAERNHGAELAHGVDNFAREHGADPSADVRYADVLVRAADGPGRLLLREFALARCGCVRLGVVMRKR
jgi:hypothetical protein